MIAVEPAQKAELLAAIRALELGQQQNVEIYTDSAYDVCH